MNESKTIKIQGQRIRFLDKYRIIFLFCIFVHIWMAYMHISFALQSPKFINRYDNYLLEFIMPNPHRQLVDTICNEVLPNMVRIYESKKMDDALDLDQFVKLIELKIELANKSLKMLSVEEQHIYRARIDAAYAENIDRLRKEIPVAQTVCTQKMTRDYNSSCYL